MEEVSFSGKGTTGGNAEGRVLNSLEFFYVGIGCGWGPYRDSVVNDWADDRVVGKAYCIFILAPRSSR